MFPLYQNTAKYSTKASYFHNQEQQTKAMTYSFVLDYKTVCKVLYI